MPGFSRTSMSDADREQFTAFMEDFYEEGVSLILEARGLDRAAWDKLVNEKAELIPEEALAAEHGIRLLGGRLRKLIPVEVPGLAETRILVVIDKLSQTPDGYPRGQGLPRKRPLGTRAQVTEDELGLQLEL